jgi:rRNA small subunit pseudouridine methyltransferase Nep1
MISLILADAEIERVPPTGPEGQLPRICGAEAVELGGIIVLDSYIHHHLLEGLESAERRGRPDIAHAFLLLAQGSKACREGRLRCYIHTKGDEVIFVGGAYRPDPNYLSFLLSISKLIDSGAIGAGEERLRLERDMDLRTLIGSLKVDAVVALTPSGRKLDLSEVLLPSIDEHLAVIIGGFPEGDYESPVYEMADYKVSLGDELLTVPDVTSRVLASIPDYQPRS